MRNAVSLMAALLIVTGCSGGALSGSATTDTSTAASGGTSQTTDTSTAVGDSSGTASQAGNGQGSSTTTTTTATLKPTISGQPTTSLNANSPYVFLPTTSDPNGVLLTFAIQNKPSWATFNTGNGELQGVPSSANVGTYAGIVISVSDGVSTVALPAFSISVTQISTGSVTLSWLPPTANTNGSPLTNLAGYRIFYGTSPTALTQSLQVANPGITSFVIGNLSSATWYFSLVSYNSANVEGPFSAVVSKTITST